MYGNIIPPIIIIIIGFIIVSTLKKELYSSRTFRNTSRGFFFLFYRCHWLKSNRRRTEQISWIFFVILGKTSKKSSTYSSTQFYVDLRLFQYIRECMYESPVSRSSAWRRDSKSRELKTLCVVFHEGGQLIFLRASISGACIACMRELAR